MKLILIVAIFLVSSNVFAQNGWRYLNSGVSQNLKSVEFANENFGIAVGDSGTALKTTDGGLTWRQLSFPNEINLTTATFTSVAFVDNTTAIIVGTYKIALDSLTRNLPLMVRSSDGGLTWKIIRFDNLDSADRRLAGITKICMSDYRNGFAVITYYPNGDGVFKTSDGGISWTLYKLYESYGIEGLDCSAKNAFIISVRTHERYHGTETGRINTIIEKPDSNISRKFSQSNLYNYFGGFQSQSIGPDAWISYKTELQIAPVMWRSFDDGITWTEVENTTPDIGRLFLSKNDYGYAVSFLGASSTSRILKTTDAGGTWAPQKHPTDIPFIRSIYSVNDTLAYAVGEKGVILKVSDDATSINDTQTRFLKETKTYPNPAADELIIQGVSGELALISSFGEVVWRGFKNEEKLKIDVSALPQGIYVLKYSVGAQMISVVR